ncbi:glycosyl transferase [Devosia pacifica]|uniref:Glycosyl transferase n=1 Tax=Devosia pacifica TaxID=1335967 RepID=A0A918VUI9_9HYPH|nr:glycosyltransferase [Devosia pacifica]GHA25433.1 glycosyl transferase [Devosia pacifica]
MRVLHFAETLYGGTGTYLNEVLGLQSNAYQRVVVLCPEDQRHLIDSAGVEVVGIQGGGRTLSGLVALANGWRHHLRSTAYDVVHLHSSFAGAIGRLVTRPAARLVYCAHGWAFAGEAGRRGALLYALAERALALSTDAIVNISESETRLAASWGLPGARCVQVANGLRDAACTPLPPNRKAKALLFVGRYDRQKGLDLLLEAMPMLAEDGFTLTMIGGNVIGHSVRPEALPAGVIDRGWQTGEDIQQAMAAADAVIVPSRWEGFGLVAVEAMRAGRPVVCSDVGGLPELVEDGVTGLVARPESRSLAETIRRLRQYDLAEMGVRAREKFESAYRAERVFAQLDAIYRNGVSRP